MNMEPIRPITSTLIRRTLGWALLCALVIGSLQAWLTYESVQSSFKRAVRDVADTHVPLLSLAVWDIEPRTIQRQINLVLESPHIGYVMLKVSTGQVFEGAKSADRARATPFIFNIPPPNRTEGSLGTLELVADMQALYREVLHSVALVLLQCLVLTALVLGMVVTILRRDLERPMRRLADFVTSLKADNLTVPLKLGRAPGHAYDEIDLVVDGFKTLQASIHRHISTLDAEVLERTRQLEAALASLKTIDRKSVV